MKAMEKFFSNGLKLPLRQVSEAEWRDVLSNFAELDSDGLSFVRVHLEEIRDRYITQRELLVGRPGRHEHRALLSQMFAHAKALLLVMKRINFPLLFPEESLTESVIRHEQLEQSLQQVTSLLAKSLEDPQTFLLARGEYDTGSGHKSLEARYIWELVFILCDHFYYNNSPAEGGPIYRVIAWLHWSCDRGPPDPDTVKKAFQRWSASKGRNPAK